MDNHVQIESVRKEFARAKAYAHEYDGNSPIAHFFNTRLKRVSELLKDVQAGRILDVGCGPAKIANVFRGRPIEYCGLDVSEDMLKVCADTFGNDPQFSFRAGSIEKLPFADSYFDAVLCLGAFEYFLDGHRAVKEIARVLKPNGLALVSMHHSRSPYRIWSNYGYGKLRDVMIRLKRACIMKSNSHMRTHKADTLFKVYSEKGLRQLLALEGLRSEDVVYYDFNFFLSPFDELFPKSSVYVSERLECLCRSRLRRLGTGFIVSSRKLRSVVNSGRHEL